MSADRALRGLGLALDDAALRAWAGAHGVRLAPGSRVDRVRYKPGTSLRAAVDGGDGGWWLLVVHSEGTWAKAGKDVSAARRLGPTEGACAVDAGLRAVLVPSAADRHLPGLRHPGVAGASTLAHNPARRAVLRRDAVALKVFTDADAPARAVAAARVLGAAGVATPAAEVLADGVLATGWVAATRPVTADDVVAVTARLAAAAPDGLPALLPHEVVAAGSAALDAARSQPGTPDDLAERLDRTSADWHRLAPRLADPAGALRPACVVHGDLSADQVVGTGDGPVLLDLDRTAVGPAGWDLASWRAAGAATGAPPEPVAPEPVAPVPPEVALAAAVVRLPEPWRRRRPGWVGATHALLDLADAVLRGGALLDAAAPRGAR